MPRTASSCSRNRLPELVRYPVGILVACAYGCLLGAQAVLYQTANNAKQHAH